ncbi:MAG: resolvase, partial [Propionibacterium sp.]
MNQLTPDPLAALTSSLEPKRAISYIRVSTREQAQRGGTTEGFSIPAQREANKRKAASLGALIVKEFVDRGESARSANRPELQKMLAYIQENQIDFCVVHKLDRLARNRADDIDINRSLDQAGVRLISTTENIDQTPGGILLHGIMSSIAEFYSRNLANEVIKGMSQKARNGGTIGKAPLGYLNRQGRDDQGRETRWVEIDPERGPLMTQAFELYATGQWTLSKLANHLNNQGLTTTPTPNKPAKPLNQNKLLDLLRNPYYQGIITYQGVQYPGKHQPLIDNTTWQKVQTTLNAHRNGERRRIHNHHLKTTIRCGQCGSRLIIHKAKARNGQTYPYFVCSYRQRNRNKCQFKAVLIHEVEQQIENIYKNIQITKQQRHQIQTHLLEELDHIYANQQTQLTNLNNKRQKLQNQQTKLLQAHYADAIPLDLLKTEQTQITRQIADIDHQLKTLTADKTKVQNHLNQALDLLQNCHQLYTYPDIPDSLKKLLNLTFFEAIHINPADNQNQIQRTITPKYQPPFDQLTKPNTHTATTASPDQRKPINSEKNKTPEDQTSGDKNHNYLDNVSCKGIVVG